MRIEIIHDKDDLFRFRIHHVHKVFHLFYPICCSPVLSDTDMVFSAKEFYKLRKYCMCHYRYIHNPLSCHCPNTQASFSVPPVSGRFFILAYSRSFRIIRRSIDVEDIFHAGYKFCVFFQWDTPVGAAVRAKFVFFQTLRIVFLLTGVSSSIRHRAAGNLDQMGLNPSISFTQRSTGIRTDIILNDISNTIFNTKLQTGRPYNCW